MSLGLPDFASQENRSSSTALLGVIRLFGIAVLAGALIITLMEWRSLTSADRALGEARDRARDLARSADELQRLLQGNADLLIAATSVESSPERVLADLRGLLPEGVSLNGFKVDYAFDGTAKAEFTVLARTPAAYDRFLEALSASAVFVDIRPGAESRPGLVKATVGANHRRPGGER